jgi:hypothetical protein
MPIRLPSIDASVIRYLVMIPARTEFLNIFSTVGKVPASAGIVRAVSNNY